MKAQKERFEQMQRIIALMDRKTVKVVEAYKLSNPFCSWDSHYMSAHTRLRQSIYRELCEQLDSLTTKFLWHDRGISSNKDMTLYNRLICRVSKQLKVKRSKLRRCSLPELEQLAA